MSIPEKWIRKLTDKGCISYSEHAQLRMGERKIPRRCVDLAILEGQVIEIQDFPEKDIQVIFRSVGEIDFYVIVAATCPVVVITVCFFMDEVWEQLGVIRQRRKRR